MRIKPINIIIAARTIDNYSVEDAKGILIQLLDSHPAIVTRIVNCPREIVHTPDPAPATDDKLYKVVIRKVGGKINAIKMVRAMTGAGLKEAKDFVEGVARVEWESSDAGKNILPFGVIAQDKTHACAMGIMEDALDEAGGMVTLDVIPQDAPYTYSY
jgi:hypothetical protein